MSAATHGHKLPRHRAAHACNMHVAPIPGGRALVFCVGSPRPVPVGQHSWTNECAQALLSMARVNGKQMHQVASTQINEVTATFMHAMDRKNNNTEPEPRRANTGHQHSPPSTMHHMPPVRRARCNKTVNGSCKLPQSIDRPLHCGLPAAEAQNSPTMAA